MTHVDRGVAVAALDEEYGLLEDLAATLTEDELLQPSACRGWTVADLMFHMLLDAQRALVTFHSPAAGPADTDFVAYWSGFQATDDAARAHARFVRLSAAAHQDPAKLVARWRETSAAARRAAARADAPFVTTQGHVLTTGDFVATLVVEATIHHLDLVANLTDKPVPQGAAVALTTKTVDRLLGRRRPADWDDETFLRKATGRLPLTETERAAFGASIPVFS